MSEHLRPFVRRALRRPASKPQVDPGDVAICSVYGNSAAYPAEVARRYPWPRLQVEMLRRFTPPGYTIYAYGHRLIPEHEEYLRRCDEVVFFSSREVKAGESDIYVWPFRHWLLRRALPNHRYIVHLDSDAFPVADDWLGEYAGALSRRSPVVAVQRLENGDTHSDRCFLMHTASGHRRHHFDFSPVGVTDVGAAISEDLAARGLTWKPLRRSNAHDYHHLIAGIYDDRIYHHAAGTRAPHFRQNEPYWGDGAFMRREQFVHRILMQRLFEETDRFIAELRGLAPPFDLDAAVAAAKGDAGG